MRRLKAIVLPVNARELYHGKGITLPATHSSIKPRQRMPPPLPIGKNTGYSMFLLHHYEFIRINTNKVHGKYFVTKRISNNIF